MTDHACLYRTMKKYLCPGPENTGFRGCAPPLSRPVAMVQYERDEDVSACRGIACAMQPPGGEGLAFGGTDDSARESSGPR